MIQMAGREKSYFSKEIKIINLGGTIPLPSFMPGSTQP